MSADDILEDLDDVLDKAIFIKKSFLMEGQADLSIRMWVRIVPQFI